MYQFYILCTTAEYANHMPLLWVSLAHELDTDSVASGRGVSVNNSIVSRQIDNLASTRAKLSILARSGGTCEFQGTKDEQRNAVTSNITIVLDDPFSSLLAKGRTVGSPASVGEVLAGGEVLEGSDAVFGRAGVDGQLDRVSAVDDEVLEVKRAIRPPLDPGADPAVVEKVEARLPQALGVAVAGAVDSNPYGDGLAVIIAVEGRHLDDGLDVVDARAGRVDTSPRVGSLSDRCTL